MEKYGTEITKIDGITFTEIAAITKAREILYGKYGKGRYHG